MPDHFGAAFELISGCKNEADDVIWNSVRAATRPRAESGYTPAVAVQAGRLFSSRSIAVFLLHAPVKVIPFLLPAPDSAAMNAALVGDDVDGEVFDEQQP
jgi:hypothetical protein